jgi:hypothetical protein
MASDVLCVGFVRLLVTGIYFSLVAHLAQAPNEGLFNLCPGRKQNTHRRLHPSSMAGPVSTHRAWGSAPPTPM